MATDGRGPQSTMADVGSQRNAFPDIVRHAEPPEADIGPQSPEQRVRLPSLAEQSMESIAECVSFSTKPRLGQLMTLGLTSEGEQSMPVLLNRMQMEVSRALNEVRTITTYDDNLEKQYKETVEENIQLSRRLDMALREMRKLKGKVCVMEMTKTEFKEEEARKRFSRDRQLQLQKELEQKRKDSKGQMVPVLSLKTRSHTVNAKGQYIDPESNKQSARGRRRHLTFPPLEQSGPRPKGDATLPPPLSGCTCSICQAVQSLGAATVGGGTCCARSGQQMVLGDRVVVKGHQSGVVKYIGRLHDDPLNATYIGVELDAPVGENDGTYRKQRYFDGRPSHGIFVKGSDIQCVTLRTQVGRKADTASKDSRVLHRVDPKESRH